MPELLSLYSLSKCHCIHVLYHQRLEAPKFIFLRMLKHLTCSFGYPFLAPVCHLYNQEIQAGLSGNYSSGGPPISSVGGAGVVVGDGDETAPPAFGGGATGAVLEAGI